MYRRDRDIDAAAYQADRYAWEPDDATWRADRDEPQRARKGFFGRLSSLIKISVLAVPAALFLYGSFADCSGRPAAGWLASSGPVPAPATRCSAASSRSRTTSPS